jgi:hypothetical protein
MLLFEVNIVKLSFVIVNNNYCVNFHLGLVILPRPGNLVLMLLFEVNIVKLSFVIVNNNY